MLSTPTLLDGVESCAPHLSEPDFMPGAAEALRTRLLPLGMTPETLRTDAVTKILPRTVADLFMVTNEKEVVPLISGVRAVNGLYTTSAVLTFPHENVITGKPFHPYLFELAAIRSRLFENVGVAERRALQAQQAIIHQLLATQIFDAFPTAFTALKRYFHNHPSEVRSNQTRFDNNLILTFPEP